MDFNPKSSGPGAWGLGPYGMQGSKSICIADGFSHLANGFLANGFRFIFWDFVLPLPRSRWIWGVLIRECGGMVDAKASKAFHFYNGVGSSPITRTNGF